MTTTVMSVNSVSAVARNAGKIKIGANRNATMALSIGIAANMYPGMTIRMYVESLE
jgi:hypothetical protein